MAEDGISNSSSNKIIDQGGETGIVIGIGLGFGGRNEEAEQQQYCYYYQYEKENGKSHLTTLWGIFMDQNWSFHGMG